MVARRAVEYIELDVDWCDNVFATHPCRATLAGTFTPDTAMTYDFADGTSSINGFTDSETSGGPATLVGGASYATFSGNNATTPRITKTVDFEGADINSFRLNLKKTAVGTTWNGYIYGFTAAGHFRKTFNEPTLNEDTTVVVDMTDSSPQSGESGSWVDKSFTSFRIDFFDASTQVFQIYTIEAGILVAGNDRCFNTLATCQDTARYDPSPVTLRFAKDNGALSKDIYALANVRSISFTPATIAVGKDMGIRATLTVTLQDRPHSDTGPGFDKYHDQRSYDPFSQGTLWGKFRARQPYLLNSVIRYIRGYEGQALVDMETRTFVVTKAQMSGANGEFVIEAQDVLRLVDRTRSQAPVQSNGYLSADRNTTDTTLTLSPTGIGAEEYDGSGYANIGGKEIVYYEHDKLARLTASTQLLLYFNGTDASTTMTDSSGNGRNGTAVGNAQLDTSDKKYGTASLLLDGTGDYVTVPDNAAWTFSGNFTIEAWIKVDAIGANQMIVCHSNNNATDYWGFRVNTAGGLNFMQETTSVVDIDINTPDGVITAGVWTHVAVVRVGSDYTIFVNGVIVATENDTTALTNYTGLLRVGIHGNSTGSPFDGWIDTLHIASTSIWTADFSADLPGPPLASADTMNITRAQLNTTANSHSAQDRVQQVLYYVSEDPADVIYDLLATYAGVSTAWLPLTEWEQETESYLQVNYTGIIHDPTSVEKLVSELCLQCALTIWWDDLNEKVRLQVLRGILSSVTIDDSNCVNGTLTIEEQPDKRVSQVWVYYGKINPLESEEKPENYRSVAVTLDLESERFYGTPSIMKIFSRWIPAGGRSVAQRLGEIIIGRFSTPPRLFKFELMNRDQESPLIELAGGVDLRNWSMQLPDGSQDTVQGQVIRYDPHVARQRVEAEEFSFSVSSTFFDRVIIIESDLYNVNVRDMYDSLYPEPDASTVVRVIVEESATVGSTSTSTFAMTIGDWPTGCSITLEVYGRIQGKGGAGGRGNIVSASARAGGAGGPALYTRFAIDIDGTGEIYGGGGGGGGGAPDFTYGGGGGGGAGFDVGLGGAGSGSGTNGTADAGGNGGNASGAAGDGGDGGGPGANGQNGQSAPSYGGSNGGAGGDAIDGDSYVTETGTVTITGDRIN